MMVVSTPVTNAPFDVRPPIARQRLDGERHQAEAQVDHHLVRHELDRIHRSECEYRADHVFEEDRPAHIVPPLIGAPAVGAELDDREQDHRARHVEVIEQHAEQDHASGHAEHTGDEGA
jgi:hypothetical protein